MSDVDNDKEEGLFKYRSKIRLAKAVFGVSIVTIGFLAGFKIGFGRSKKKFGTKNTGSEDPVHFAAKALKRATFITFGCFALCTGAVCLATGISSLSDLRNISRRKWMHEDSIKHVDSQPEKDQFMSYSEVDKNEILVDKAGEMTDT